MNGALVMDPTWGALEDAQDPQRRAALARLLAGQRGIDPGSTPIGGLPNEEVPWKLRPVGSAVPEAVTAPPAPEDPGGAPPRAKMMADILGAARAGGRPAAAKPPTVYDTPYGAELRAADEEVKKAFNGYDQRATRYNQGRLSRLADSYVTRKIAMKESGATTEPMSIYDTPYGEQIRASEEKLKKARGYQVKPALEDRDHFTRLAERHIAQTEGLEDHWDSVGAKERASENELLAAVLGGSDKDQEGIRKERMTRMLAKSKRYSRGTPMDRGEDGVWQEIADNETGDSTWEKTSVPAKRRTPTIHSIGAGGSVFLGEDGKPQRIPRVTAPPSPSGSPAGGEAPAKQPRITDVILKAVMEKVMSEVDPSDPDAIGRALALVRKSLPGVIPGGEPGPDPAAAAAMTHQQPSGPVLSGTVGQPARGGGKPPTATDPKTGRKAMWDGSAWVPLR